MNQDGPKFQFDADAVKRMAASLHLHIRNTPLLKSGFNQDVLLKAESLQVTGSFKVRAAFSQLLQLSPQEAAKGIVTSSSGNFAISTAYAAYCLGLSAKIVMMDSSNPVKVEKTRRWGGEVVFCGDRFEARAETVSRLVSSENRQEIAGYDHPLAVLGNATIGAEIIERYPDVENIVAPISGGGLISGVAVAASIFKPAVRVWGVQPAGANATYLSFQAREFRNIDRARTMADGLIVTRPGKVTFPLILKYVHDVVVVSEDSIFKAVQHFLKEERLVVEPAGAVGLAAVMEGVVPAKRTVLVLSGGNISQEILLRAAS